MQAAAVLVLVLGVAITGPQGVGALKLTGHLQGPESWVYLGKFCFLPSSHETSDTDKIKGQLKAKFKFRPTSRMSLLLYLERSADYQGTSVSSFNSWTSVYSSTLNCTERMAAGMTFPLWDPDLENACQNVLVSGRTRTNGVINGEWGPYKDPESGSETWAGRRIYARETGDGWLFMFFKADVGKWFISKELKSNMVVAQVESQALSPDLFDRDKEIWQIADGNDDFEDDRNVTVVCMDRIMTSIKDCSDQSIPEPPPPLPPPPSIGGGIQNPNSAGYVELNFTQNFTDSVARWIFLAASNCDPECAKNGTSLCQGPMDLEYEMELTNGVGWGVMHFTADEIGILEMEYAFFVIQLVLFALMFLVRLKLMAIQKYHYTVQLLHCSIGVTLLSDFCDIVHYGMFASNGIGSPRLHVFSQWLTGFSETILLLMIVLVAKGWSICCRKISATGRVKIAVYTTVYLLLWTGLLIWYTNGVSSAEVVYLYHCTPGYLVCCMRVFGVVWLCYATYVTIHKFQTKKRFFMRFAMVFSIWLLALPVIVLMAIGIPLWVRAKVVNALELIFTALAQGIMVGLYYPANYNHSFPFHATTTDMNPRYGARTVKKNEIEGVDNMDSNRRTSMGNTRIVHRGNRLDKAAVRGALELASRVTTDLNSLRGALETLEANHDDEEEELPEEGGFSSLQSGSGGGAGFFGGGGRGLNSTRAMNYTAGGTANPMTPAGVASSFSNTSGGQAGTAAGTSLRAQMALQGQVSLAGAGVPAAGLNPVNPPAGGGQQQEQRSYAGRGSIQPGNSAGSAGGFGGFTPYSR